ncbi:unnamed protein product [Effrenium voratum]|nr:unnamed protein product [Effrenium voratum]
MGEATHALISAGQELIRKLKDPSVDPEELLQVAHTLKEERGILAARDEKGRSPLHVAASRGDLRLCRAMMEADPGLVNQLDGQKNTPIMEAAFLGRCMIVKELVERAAEINRKNGDLMNALQLACVNEGAGNGETKESSSTRRRSLKQTGALTAQVPKQPFSAQRVGEDMIPQWAFRQQRARKDGVSLGEAVWDIELLHSGEEGLVNYCAYLWEEVDRLSELRGQAKIESPRTKELLLHVLQTALAVLIDLGADPWQMNGSGFTALDYARDMETAQFLYDLMEGDKLSDKAAPRIDASRLFKDAEARRARLHKASPKFSLEEAFRVLEAPLEWIPAFEGSGEHFNELRKAWRRLCLRCHPDKQPEGLEDEAAAEWTAQFQAAMAAFEVVDRHFRAVAGDAEGA